MLSYRIVIGTGEDRHGEPISVSRRVQAVGNIKYDAAASFGGFTFTWSGGGWINGEGRLVEERSAVFDILADEPASYVREWARKQGGRLDQECIVIVYHDGAGEIVNV